MIILTPEMLGPINNLINEYNKYFYNKEDDIRIITDNNKRSNFIFNQDLNEILHVLICEDVHMYNSYIDCTKCSLNNNDHPECNEDFINYLIERYNHG